MAIQKNQNEQQDQAKATDQRAQDRRRDESKDENATALPDGGQIVEPKAGDPANAQADTDLVDRTVRSQEQVTKKGDADPLEVVDKDHVEVAGGRVPDALDPHTPAPGTLLPKDPGAPPQGTNPGAHVPAPKRVSSSGAPLN